MNILNWTFVLQSSLTGVTEPNADGAVLSEKNSARKKALQHPGSPSNAADAGIFYFLPRPIVIYSQHSYLIFVSF